MRSNIFKTPLRYIGVAATIFAVMPSIAYATCSSPAGTKGEMIYNDDHSAMQYCDNTNWIAMGRPYTASAPPPSGLIMHWKMDETSGTTISDSTGNGNTGTLVNGPVWVRGKLNNAIDLDGSNDYITGPDNASLDFGANDFSISMWVKKQTSSSGWDDTMGISKWNSGGSPGTNEWNFSIGTLDSDAPGFTMESGTTNYTALSPRNLVINQWHHLIGMRDGTNIKFYLDGALEATTAVGTAAINNTGLNIKIGIVTSYYSNAIFDDVRIYDHALTDDEIGEVSGSNPDITAGLVGHWKMDETSGTTASDSSSSGNNATLTNMDGATDWVSGKFSNALDFDGGNDHVRIPNSNTSLRFTGNGSISSWIKLNPSFNTAGIIFLKQSDLNSTVEWGLSLKVKDTKQVQFSVVHTEGFDHSHKVESPKTITDNNWHHLIGVWKSPNIKLYIDGVEVDSINVGTGTLRTGTTLPSSIGAQHADGATAQFFDGKIDDVRVYDRDLNIAEIEELFCLGSAGKINYNSIAHVMEYCTGINGSIGMGADRTNLSLGDEPVVSTNLVGHWKFNETSGTTATDSSSSGNNATLTNMSGATDWVGGKFNNALDFDGIDDWLIPTSPDPGIFHDEVITRTISAWVTTNSVGGPNIIYEEGGGTHGLVMHYRSNPDTFHFATRQNTTEVEIGSTSTFAPNPNAWVHIVAIYDNGTMKLYINGKLEATGSNGTTIPYHSGEPAFGLNNGSSAIDDDTETPWVGKIDDLRIYDRILTDAEIIQLLATSSCTNPTAPEGQMIYNDAHAVMQYCNGNDWVAIGK